ncbi:MAG: Ser-Thr-rich GPI-anchored membrane family protein, partial [Planctomycetota bacterium]
MVQRSDLVIRGKVISTESLWKEDSRGRHIYTIVTVKILDKIKGNIKDDAFVFEVVGGTVDDIREVVSDTPAFEVDEDAILFLAGDPLAIQHGINGKILIYDGRVYLEGSEVTTDSFIQTLKILGQNPNAPTSLEGKYPAPTEGIEVEECYIYEGDKWFGTSPTVCYYINQNTSDCSGEGAAVQRGANTWNDAGADFTFQYCGSCSSTSQGMNGINCIMWGTTSGSLATAWRWTNPGTGEIVECDIVFNDNYIWSTDPDTPFGEYDVESVAVHELGHWLHLADLYDSADSDKVMYGYLGDGEEMRTLHSCDIDGICYIYGCPSCSITVTSPTDGSNWNTGALYPIMWNSSNNPGSSVKIELYKGSSLIQTITSSTNDDGSYSWVIPTSLAADNDYRIKITATLDSSCYDYSSYFGIDTLCSIVVSSPNGGDCWEVGQVYNINWISHITSGDVKIELYKGVSLDRVITPSTPDTGTYAWSVPVDGSLTGDCYYLIRITDVLSSSCYDYSNYFCIATPPEAQDDNVTTSKGIPVMITLQTTDEGCPNPPAALTHIITSLPIHGNLNDPGASLIADPCTSLVGYGNQVEYIPETGYEGQDSFTFIAYDGGVPLGGGDSNEAIITINVVDCTTVTIGTGTNPWSYPMRTYYHDSRTQVIYLAGEIGIPGNIKDLALDVAIAPGQTMNNWTIRMKHTSLDNYSSPYSLDATGWTTVYDENESISSTGWRTFTFETPFAYNGTDNLLVDFSHNNSSYSSNGYCMASNPGPPRSTNAYSNSVYGDPLTWSGTTPPPVTGNSSVPNVQLTICGECSLDAPVFHAEPDTTQGTYNTIYWDPIADANWYYAECANDADFANTVIGSGWISETSCTFTSLDLEYKYWYRVKAAPRIESWSQTSQAEFQTDTLVDTRATNNGDVVLTGGAVPPVVDTVGGTGTN